MIPNSRTNSAEYIERVQVVIEELRSQSDRGVAIVGGAWVEEGLLGMLYVAFQPDSAIWKRATSNYGPLSTFAAKIDMAHLLRLVSRHIYNDLNAIRGIRNAFAHDVAHKKTHEQLSFASSDIKKKCLELRCVEHEKLSNPRHAFIRACAMLSADFESMQDFVQIPHLGTVNAHNEY
jgi:DNA-binding MltR family transcriptional regulator